MVWRTKCSFKTEKRLISLIVDITSIGRQFATIDWIENFFLIDSRLRLVIDYFIICSNFSLVLEDGLRLPYTWTVLKPAQAVIITNYRTHLNRLNPYS